MWWTQSNLDKPRRDKRGRLWHFRVWYDFRDGLSTQRIYFWDNDHKEMGVVELVGDQTLDVSRLRQRIAKLVSSPEYRQRFHRELRFPIERHY
jgi:hypothetical protein